MVCFAGMKAFIRFGSSVIIIFTLIASVASINKQMKFLISI